MESRILAADLPVARPAVVPHRRPGLPLPAALLCDLDGTLVDTMPALADLASELIAPAYAMPRSLARELYLATCGLPFSKQLATIFPDDPRNEAVAARFEAEKPARCSAARMPSDTRRALITLQGRGVRIVVSSNNGTENVDAFARQAGFGFDLALGYGDGLGKGEPHVRRVQERFGIGRERMVFVGDSLHDGEIAEAGRLGFVAVAGTFSKERFTLRFPTHPVVQRFADLVDLFD